MDRMPILICLITTFFMTIHAIDSGNISTIKEPKGSGIKCFKCTSWQIPQCSISVYHYVALSYFTVVYCSDDCIKMVIKHDGTTDVIRGCSSGAEMDDHTCDDDYCNHGVSASTGYSFLIVTTLYNLVV
ncbi:uncharacterized protein [Mytilus edulis]|uniref:uncharacterized protein n=1 Tax=Mytilus edulis TaxID=6550 RepID=UPI0039F05C56